MIKYIHLSSNGYAEWVEAHYGPSVGLGNGVFIRRYLYPEATIPVDSE